MKQSITVKLNVWIICAVLLIANLITIGLWQPWVNRSVSGRTVAVTGSTTIQAEPDQFIFSPYYQKEGSDKTAINTELSDLSKTIVTKVKSLGVKDSAIKTNANSYDNGTYYYDDSWQDSVVTAALSLTITLQDKVLAQKVQDYLATTEATGSITPIVSFSITKQKTLETQARSEALADAKSKAATSAKQLGTTLGKAVKVSDITSGGISPLPWLVSGSSESAVDLIKSQRSESSSYTIQPGLNDYSFSVDVTYELN